MGVKKKEEKKQEDIIDLSTLPPCRTLLIAVIWHPYLNLLAKYLKISEYKCLTREDLIAYLKEKNIEPTASSLASACKAKIEELQLPIRKERKDSPRKDEPSKFDLTLIIKAYPLTSEEVLELDATENLIEVFMYLRPTLSHLNNHYKKKTDAYNQKLAEIGNTGSESPSLIRPQQVDLYLSSIHTLDKLSIIKKPYKNLFIHVEQFESEEDLEFKEEIKDDKDDVKKKDVKAPQKKVEEPKEEEIDFNDPKFKVCSGFVEEIKKIVSARVEFDNWQKALRLVPLYPESSLQPSKSQTSLESGKRSEQLEKPQISLDDSPKSWDFTYFYALINSFSDISCSPNTILACILRWICRDSSNSPLFSLSASVPKAITVHSSNNPTSITTSSSKFYLSSDELKSTISHIVSHFKISGINRYSMPAALSDASRIAETTSLLSFTSFPTAHFERYLNILTFEKMLKTIHSERQWDLGNRIFEETLPIEEFQQLYLYLNLFEPEILTEYIPRTDSLLMCVLFKTPPGRIIRKAWRSPWRVCPNFAQYANNFNDKHLSEFYDVNPNLVGCVKERTKIMYPADNSVIKMVEFHAGPRKPQFDESLLRPKYRPIVYKDGWYFGIRKHQANEFWACYTDERILAEVSETGLELTFTLNSGLIVKVLATGEILQEKPGSSEENRVIFTSGSVCRYYKDGSAELLHPSGEVSKISKDKLWVITNKRGKRIAKRNKITYPMDPISITTQIDAETSAKVTIREDLVMSLTLSDNSFAVFHSDGTRIHTSADKNTIYIESPGYAPVKVFKDPIKARQNTVIGLGSSDSGLGAEDIMLRSNDGVLIECILPNRTKIQSFVQKQELEAYNEFSTNRINLINRSDGAVIKTSSDGEVVFITGPARDALAETGGNNAYFYEIFTLPDERNSGVYTARVDSGRLWTKDNEGNYFEVTTGGKSIEKLAVSLNVEDSEPASPVFSASEYLDPECKFLPPPASIIAPRVFLIKNNSAVEYFEKSQLSYYFKNSKGKYYKESTTDFVSHSWIHQSLTSEPFAAPGSPFESYSLPKLVKPILQTQILSKTPKPVSYIQRKLREFPAMNEEIRELVEKNLKEFEDWGVNKEKNIEGFAVIDRRNDIEKNKADSFMQRLLRFRGVSDVKLVEVDEDKVSEFYVELSENEPEEVVQIERKVSNFRMDSV